MFGGVSQVLGHVHGRNRISVDRILVFTDEQLYDSTSWGSNRTIAEVYKVYKRTVNPNAKLYVFDLSGHGTTMLPRDEPNVALISGWSEQVFKFMDTFEKDALQAVEYIEENY